ncbi:hypothetical protein [Halorubrum sp. Atlit-28R]|uniref:hypothetical protein n=1 Tax=Halorubrum sp. Atlit-28R TaxID=2282129 RepID=UPI000EF1AD5F|nr:hypothetical protein [Halorubrum sp. Atlit-28R]RLM49749.1 hypothetical protein DVK06_13270 [Halorubrum sp. Atlit-28R]
MNALRTTLLVALATVVLIGTGAAAGAVAATPGPDSASGDAGPPGDLPDQVPDFVGGILDSVNEFLGGGVDDLGETVSEVAGNGAGESDASDGTDADGGA